VEGAEARLAEAMRYATLNGGKRLRAFLVMESAALFSVNETCAARVAASVEMIHAYSLVHDDLPAMDDDDLRRGRPTCHRAYDEATAVLVGDALQPLAFEVLARDPSLPASAEVRLRLVELLAQASGSFGMAGGQAIDLTVKGHRIELASLEAMHERKTGALIRASVMMAAACVPGLPAGAWSALQSFAQAIGLAFQIQDDVLDVTGDVTTLGKAVGADERQARPTYPAIMGLQAARERVQRLHAQASEALAPFGTAAAPLLQVSSWLLARRN